MAFTKRNYVSGETVITAKNLNEIQDAIIALESNGGAGMDITGATVGQIAKIAAVDASGKPTAWEPVDMADKLPNPSALTFTGAVTGSYDGSAPVSVKIPSGGGGSNLPTPTAYDVGKVPVVLENLSYGLEEISGGASSAEEWVQIADYTWTAEDAAQTSTIYFNYGNDINGDPLSIDAIWIIYSALTEADRTLYFRLGTDSANKNYIGNIQGGLKNNQKLYVYAEMFPNTKHAIIDYSHNSSLHGGNTATRKLWVPVNDSYFVFPATGVCIYANGRLLEGSNFKIFGRKKNV